MTRLHRLLLVAATFNGAIWPTGLLLADEVGAPAAAPADQLAAPSVARLIEQLDSNRYQDREAATQALIAAGAVAFEPLLAAANGDRPEPTDRAVWVLRKLGDSDDRELALGALDHLVLLKNRPAVVEEARLARGRIYELVCQEKLAKLGAQLSIEETNTPEGTLVRLVQVEIGDKWRGTSDDLQCLSQLGDHRYFRLIGAPIGDTEMKMFETMDDLAMLQIWRTSVTPAAVDAIKEHQPKAVINVRNRALLGIEGATHEAGVLVRNARPNTAAANAGIVAGDIITTLDGKPIRDFDRLTAQISQYAPGDEINVTILRGEEKLTKTVSLSDWSQFDPLGRF